MIKWLFKWVFRLALLLVILLVVLVLSLDTLVRNALEWRIREETGLQAQIGRVSVGILSPSISVLNLKVYNTAEFGGSPFLDIPEVHAEYDRLALLRQKLHLTLLRFNLAEANVVRNEAGRTNITQTAKRAPGKGSNRVADLQFAGIDVLNLTVGRVRFVDLKHPQMNQERIFGIKNQVFKNVKTIGDLRGILFVLWLRSGGGLFSAQPEAPPPAFSPSWPSASEWPADTGPDSSRRFRETRS